MNLRENTLAVLRYQPYEKMPVVAFGYWEETLFRWAEEGHVTREEAEDYATRGDNGEGDRSVMRKLGFDFNWSSSISASVLLFPRFEVEMLETAADGSRVIRDELGLICRVKPGVTSIPSEIGTSLTDRAAWESLYLPKLQMCAERIPYARLRALPAPEDREIPIGINLGSLIGHMRNFLGVEHLSYLYADDEELYREIVDTLCGLCYDCAKAMFETGAVFDCGHFWEDICCKSGPLVSPSVFDALVGPWYQKITSLAAAHGVDIISLDCDGMIDALIPTWLGNGVNTMFPIEVGTWNASIAPWREKYGRALRGVGGMNKNVFSRDKKAVDVEIDRLRALISLGGYVPCPDHRIAPDAKFELVQYYCEQMHRL